MPDVGVPELLIIAVIALLIFGPAKAADLGGALGKGIREFRKASTQDGAPAAPVAPSTTASPDGPPVPSRATRFCNQCGATLAGGQKFCNACGASATAT